ncbi:tetratricopeptide repeat protein, partial [bacterium]|nr:tetratricopeptide repeat protein [Nanoarchaeota archaeon]MBU1627586.1 tetratricopeptide repeat protein [bacterium]
INLATPYHIIVLGQKLPDGQTPENSKHLDVRVPWRKGSPFLTDLVKSVLPDLVSLPQGPAEIEKFIRQILSLAPIEEEAEANLLLHLAYIHYQQGKFSEAEEELKKALSLESFNKDLMIGFHYAMGSYYERQGKLSEAVEKFEEIVKDQERFREENFIGGAHFHLGCIYNKLRKKEKAKQHFEECLRLSRSIKRQRHI